MPRRIDEVEIIGVAVVGFVINADGLAFDGDSALTLDIHGVEKLGLHVARGNRARKLQNAIRQSGLAVVDMRDDREVPNVSGVDCHDFLLFSPTIEIACMTHTPNY